MSTTATNRYAQDWNGYSEKWAEHYGTRYAHLGDEWCDDPERPRRVGVGEEEPAAVAGDDERDGRPLDGCTDRSDGGRRRRDDGAQDGSPVQKSYTA